MMPSLHTFIVPDRMLRSRYLVCVPQQNFSGAENAVFGVVLIDFRLGVAPDLVSLYPSRPRLARVGAVLEAPDLVRLAESDVYWDDVVAIEPLGPEPVELAPRLWGQEPDVYFNIARYWRTIQSYVAELFAWRALDALRREPAMWGGTPLFVYGFGWGIQGSAAGTAIWRGVKPRFTILR